MSLECQGVLMKSFIEYQVVYCPLVRTCCDKTSDNRMNHLHERALRTVYNENVSTFEKLLEKDNSAIIHVRNLKTFAIELCKIKKNLVAPIMHETFKQKNNNLLSQTDIQLGSVKTVNYGLRAFSYLGPKICNIVPIEIKNSETFEQFTMKIKSWKPTHCPCHLCQPYFHCLGYI